MIKVFLENACQLLCNIYILSYYRVLLLPVQLYYIYISYTLSVPISTRTTSPSLLQIFCACRFWHLGWVILTFMYVEGGGNDSSL